MTRIERAKQFAPFDALKGLSTALRIKEYEHERIMKGDMMEDQAEKISDCLMSLEKGSKVHVKHYHDGYEYFADGIAKLDLEKGELSVGEKEILLDDILDISIIKN